MMRRGITLMLLLVVLSLVLCSCSVTQQTKQDDVPNNIETVIVKETVIVSETVYATEPTIIKSEVESEDKTDTSTGKVGYTTADILKKAAQAADKQYWIVFYEGTRGNRIEMSSFNALEDFSVSWNKDITCEKQVGECTQFKFDENSNGFVETGKYGKITDEATGIIGSNCEIYDIKNDSVIR